MNTFLQGVKADESLRFPDGQPHVVFGGVGTFSSLVTCRIVSGDDLLKLGMLADVCRFDKPQLRIMYLMGARMDRRLSDDEPYTLKVVCDFINSLGFPRVSVFCPHSQATSDLLDNYVAGSLQEDAFYDRAVWKFNKSIDDVQDSRQFDFTIVYPDEGASKRYRKSAFPGWWPNCNIVVLEKARNERTGRVDRVEIKHGTPKRVCLIVDDLCDGGATFVMAAEAEF